MLFSGSLLKVALLYASFELRARLNKLGLTVASDWTPFLTAVRSAVPWITDGEEREMKISEAMAFNTSDSGAITFDLRENHRADLEAVFEHQLQSLFARQ
jgi:hypothetical protein